MASQRSQTRPTSSKTDPISSSAPKNTPKKPITFSKILELLEIQNPEQGDILRCHGLNKDRSSCRNHVLKALSSEIASIVRNLANSWHRSPSTLTLLGDLSKLVMCRRFHQGQASSKCSEWESKLPLTPSGRGCGLKTNGGRSRYVQSTCHDVRTSDPVSSKSPTVASTVPLSSTSHDRRQLRSQTSRVQPSETTDNTKVPTKARNNATASTSVPLGSDLPTPVSQRTRSKAQATSPSPASQATTTTFEPYTKTLPSLPVATRKLISKIQASISSNEQKSGWVYGFKRPNCSLIKIGTTTKTPRERLDTIGSNCNYTPELVFKFPIPHAMKVEKLVHLHLYKERRKEVLLNGVCNDGKGCTQKHQEWFDVTVEYARSVVNIWAEWIQLEPYDNAGSLKSEWVQAFKIINWQMSDFEKTSWTKITSPITPSLKKEDEDKVKIKSETEVEDIESIPMHSNARRRVARHIKDEEAEAENNIKAKFDSIPEVPRTRIHTRLQVPVKKEEFRVKVKVEAVDEIQLPRPSRSTRVVRSLYTTTERESGFGKSQLVAAC